jgi:sn-glycerol 3-phosphate transport system substrate-binding protein
MAHFIAMRRSIAKLALVTLVALSMGTVTAQETVNLQFWFAYTGPVQEANEQLTKTFNETVGKDKKITVTAMYQGGYPELNQKVQAAHIAGNPPDVFVLDMGTTGTFATNGVIEPLDRMMSRDSYKLDDFQNGIMENGVVKKKVYALPYLPSTSIMFMNTTLLKKAGLDPEGPKTWDELAYYCKTVKEKTGAFGLTMFSWTWLYEAFLKQQGTSVLNQEENATNIGGKSALEVLTFFNDLKNAGYIKILSSADASKLSAEIAGQKTAMWFFSTAAITSYMGLAKSSGFEINAAFLPKKIMYGTSIGGANLAISSKIPAKSKDAAWIFIKWMTDTQQTIYASQKTGYMPTRISAIESAEMKQLYAKIPMFKIAVDQMQYASSSPKNPMFNEASKVIVKSLDAVWIDGQNAATVFADAEKKVNAILNE